MSNRCLAYVRVSSDEQERTGFSIPVQKRRIEDYAIANGLEIAEWFEEAHSARRSGRPEFESLLRRLDADRGIRVVLVHKQDRLSRNLTDWARLTEQLGVRVIAVAEPSEDTPMGRLTQSLGLGFAKFFSDNLSNEVKKGMRGKFEHGGLNYKAPLGYVNIPRTKTRPATVAIDEPTAEVVVACFNWYLESGGAPLVDVSDWLYERGLRSKTGKRFTPKRVDSLLRNPFYVGDVKYRDEVNKGAHDGIVPRSTWERVQALLAERGVNCQRRVRRVFLSRGLLYCARCHSRLTAETHPRGSYYRCSLKPRQKCSSRYRRVERLDEAVETHFHSLQLDDTRLRLVREQVSQLRDERVSLRKRRIRSLERTTRRIDGQLARLTDSFVRGVVEEPQYLLLKEGYLAERAQVARAVADAGSNVIARIEELEASLSQASMLSSIYHRATTKQRKQLLSMVFKRIDVDDSRIVRIEYNTLFAPLVEGDTASILSGKMCRHLVSGPHGGDVQ